MALALDGSASIYASSGTSAATGTLTCSGAGRVICVAITHNGGGDVTSVTGTGATFTFRARSASGTDNIEFFTGYASGTFSSAVTANFGSSASFITIHAFGISGAAASSYFDTNASLPGTNTTNANIVISTTNADDFIVGAYRYTGGNINAFSPWTRILGGTGSGYQMTEYYIVSAAQTNLSVDRGNTQSTGGVGDAIIMASAGSAIKTINGLALASVKTMNGLAIASVKTVNGLA